MIICALKQHPSIFNDVMGPVMIGPSSSHTAGPARIGKLARQLVNSNIIEAVVKFPATGSLVTTYSGQGTDRGLAGGLLGLTPGDEGISRSLELIREAGIKLEFQIAEWEPSHPNELVIVLIGKEGNQTQVTAKSVGGGMVEISEVDGLSVSISGDYHELLVFVESTPVDQKEQLSTITTMLSQDNINIESYHITNGNNGNTELNVINIKTLTSAAKILLTKIEELPWVVKVYTASPVLPVLSRQDFEPPFTTVDELLHVMKDKDMDLSQAAIYYECLRSGWSEDQVFSEMGQILDAMELSIKEGINPNAPGGKILPPQSHLLEKAYISNELVPGGAVNRATMLSMAVLEANSALKVVVAAPTAGSCGVIPGAVLGSAIELSSKRNNQIKGLLAAGCVGLLIANQATFAGEVCGCQAECGAASAMSAAGVVQLNGGTGEQAITAASLALQNVLGMICDPVAELVEVPCLGKNVMAASNAIVSSNMAIAGVDSIIPLGEVIDAMYAVGKELHPKFKCTGLGGLATTPSGQRIKRDIT